MRTDISDFVASSLGVCRPFVFLVFLWATQPEITRLMIGSDHWMGGYIH